MDAVDWRLLEELQRDARLSFNELSRRVNLSSPAVAERVRRLSSPVQWRPVTAPETGV